MESVKICRFKTFWVEIFAQRTLLPSSYREWAVEPQYTEYTVGPLSGATCTPINNGEAILLFRKGN